MGKARVSSGRQRSAREFQQLLIADYLDEVDEALESEVPVRVMEGGSPAGSVGAGVVTGVRVVAAEVGMPFEAAVAGTPPCPAARSAPASPAACPPIIPPRRRAANPAVVGPPRPLRRPARRFRWGRLMAGFLTSFVPGVALLLLLSYLAR